VEWGKTFNLQPSSKHQDSLFNLSKVVGSPLFWSCEECFDKISVKKNFQKSRLPPNFNFFKHLFNAHKHVLLRYSGSGEKRSE
jgi:hypothetical protein